MKNKIHKILLLLVGIALGIEVIRDAFRGGDFIGYVNAGQLVLDHRNIYSDPLNTWPPLFSIISIPLTWMDYVSPYGLRMFWLLGSILAMGYIIKLSYEILVKRNLTLNPFKDHFILYSITIFIPFLISFRYLLDNLANIQINIYMLLMAVTAHYFLEKKKLKLAAFILAFSISIKVYTIFLFLYYLYKRKIGMVSCTIIFLLVLNLIPFLVFGFDNAVGYYEHWWHEIASPPPTAHHKNQSIFGALLRIFTSEYPGHSYYINVADLDPGKIKSITYILITLVASYPAYLFRKSSSSYFMFCEIAFVLASIPILTPLSWKAYFIFLFPAYLVLYYLLWKKKTLEGNWRSKIAKPLFLISVLFTVFSTEGIMGDYFSDILESYSIILVGTCFLLINIIIVYPFLKED